MDVLVLLERVQYMVPFAFTATIPVRFLAGDQLIRGHPPDVDIDQEPPKKIVNFVIRRKTDNGVSEEGFLRGISEIPLISGAKPEFVTISLSKFGVLEIPERSCIYSISVVEDDEERLCALVGLSVYGYIDQVFKTSNNSDHSIRDILSRKCVRSVPSGDDLEFYVPENLVAHFCSSLTEDKQNIYLFQDDLVQAVQWLSQIGKTNREWKSKSADQKRVALLEHLKQINQDARQEIQLFKFIELKNPRCNKLFCELALHAKRLRNRSNQPIKFSDWNDVSDKLIKNRPGLETSPQLEYDCLRVMYSSVAGLENLDSNLRGYSFIKTSGTHSETLKSILSKDAPQGVYTFFDQEKLETHRVLRVIDLRPVKLEIVKRDPGQAQMDLVSFSNTGWYKFPFIGSGNSPVAVSGKSSQGSSPDEKDVFRTLSGCLRNVNPLSPEYWGLEINHTTVLSDGLYVGYSEQNLVDFSGCMLKMIDPDVSGLHPTVSLKNPAIAENPEGEEENPEPQQEAEQQIQQHDLDDLRISLETPKIHTDDPFLGILPRRIDRVILMYSQTTMEPVATETWSYLELSYDDSNLPTNHERLFVWILPGMEAEYLNMVINILNVYYDWIEENPDENASFSQLRDEFVNFLQTKCNMEMDTTLRIFMCDPESQSGIYELVVLDFIQGAGYVITQWLSWEVECQRSVTEKKTTEKYFKNQAFEYAQLAKLFPLKHLMLGISSLLVKVFERFCGNTVDQRSDRINRITQMSSHLKNVTSVDLEHINHPMAPLKDGNLGMFFPGENAVPYNPFFTQLTKLVPDTEKVPGFTKAFEAIGDCADIVLGIGSEREFLEKANLVRTIRLNPHDVKIIETYLASNGIIRSDNLDVDNLLNILQKGIPLAFLDCLFDVCKGSKPLKITLEIFQTVVEKLESVTDFQDQTITTYLHQPGDAEQQEREEQRENYSLNWANGTFVEKLFWLELLVRTIKFSDVAVILSIHNQTAQLLENIPKKQENIDMVRELFNERRRNLVRFQELDLLEPVQYLEQQIEDLTKYASVSNDIKEFIRVFDRITYIHQRLISNKKHLKLKFVRVFGLKMSVADFERFFVSLVISHIGLLAIMSEFRTTVTSKLKSKLESAKIAHMANSLKLQLELLELLIERLSENGQGELDMESKFIGAEFIDHHHAQTNGEDALAQILNLRKTVHSQWIQIMKRTLENLLSYQSIENSAIQKFRKIEEIIRPITESISTITGRNANIGGDRTIVIGYNDQSDEETQERIQQRNPRLANAPQNARIVDVDVYDLNFDNDDDPFLGYIRGDNPPFLLQEGQFGAAVPQMFAELPEEYDYSVNAIVPFSEDSWESLDVMLPIGLQVYHGTPETEAFARQVQLNAYYLTRESYPFGGTYLPDLMKENWLANALEWETGLITLLDADIEEQTKEVAQTLSDMLLVQIDPDERIDINRNSINEITNPRTRMLVSLFIFMATRIFLAKSAYQKYVLACVHSEILRITLGHNSEQLAMLLVQNDPDIKMGISRIGDAFGGDVFEKVRNFWIPHDVWIVYGQFFDRLFRKIRDITVTLLRFRDWYSGQIQERIENILATQNNPQTQKKPGFLGKLKGIFGSAHKHAEILPNRPKLPEIDYELVDENELQQLLLLQIGIAIEGDLVKTATVELSQQVIKQLSDNQLDLEAIGIPKPIPFVEEQFERKETENYYDTDPNLLNGAKVAQHAYQFGKEGELHDQLADLIKQMGQQQSGKSETKNEEPIPGIPQQSPRLEIPQFEFPELDPLRRKQEKNVNPGVNAPQNLEGRPLLQEENRPLQEGAVKQPLELEEKKLEQPEEEFNLPEQIHEIGPELPPQEQEIPEFPPQEQGISEPNQEPQQEAEVPPGRQEEPKNGEPEEAQEQKGGNPPQEGNLGDIKQPGDLGTQYPNYVVKFKQVLENHPPKTQQEREDLLEKYHKFFKCVMLEKCGGETLESAMEYAAKLQQDIDNGEKSVNEQWSFFSAAIEYISSKLDEMADLYNQSHTELTSQTSSWIKATISGDEFERSSTLLADQKKRTEYYSYMGMLDRIRTATTKNKLFFTVAKNTRVFKEYLPAHSNDIEESLKIYRGYIEDLSKIFDLDSLILGDSLPATLTLDEIKRDRLDAAKRAVPILSSLQKIITDNGFTRIADKDAKALFEEMLNPVDYIKIRLANIKAKFIQAILRIIRGYKTKDRFDNIIDSQKELLVPVLVFYSDLEKAFSSWKVELGELSEDSPDENSEYDTLETFSRELFYISMETLKQQIFSASLHCIEQVCTVSPAAFALFLQKIFDTVCIRIGRTFVRIDSKATSSVVKSYKVHYERILKKVTEALAMEEYSEHKDLLRTASDILKTRIESLDNRNIKQTDLPDIMGTDSNALKTQNSILDRILVRDGKLALDTPQNISSKFDPSPSQHTQISFGVGDSQKCHMCNRKASHYCTNCSYVTDYMCHSGLCVLIPKDNPQNQ